jgi:hypothetical protein
VFYVNMEHLQEWMAKRRAVARQTVESPGPAVENARPAVEGTEPGS